MIKIISSRSLKTIRRNSCAICTDNGFDDYSISDVRIGIDPELMLERTDNIQCAVLDGNFNATLFETTGFELAQFVPLNALNNTGLFFMTINENLLLLDDGTNVLNEIENMGNMMIERACDTPGYINVYSGVPPVGSEVEHWGLFAANLVDSFFVIDNKLDEREPCANAKKNLVCYDDDVKNECLIVESCSLSCSVTTEVEYDSGSDQTTITVNVKTNAIAGATLVYDLAYSLSDGTGQSGITTGSFVNHIAR